MSKFFYLCVFGITGCLLLCFGLPNAKKTHPDGVRPQRIVSLAPAITETIYALGLGENVVGVTEFCAWPPEAAQKPKTGGFREVNPEAIARADADLVILPADMAHFKDSIEKIGAPVLLFDYSSLSTFLNSVMELGFISGKAVQAAEFTQEFAKAAKNMEAENRPRVLFTLLNPDECKRPLSEMTVIGADGFYSDLIYAAGGRNAYTGKTPFPRMSLEAVIALKPDIIVVGAPELADSSELEKRWREIDHLQGVKGDRLLILTDPGDTIPGPRSLATLKKLARAIEAVGNETERK